MKNTLFCTAFALALAAANCGSQDPPLPLDGEYIATLISYEGTCPNGHDPAPNTRLVIRVAGTGEGTFDFTIAPGTIAEVYIPEVPVEPDGNFFVSYPWEVDWLPNETTLTFAGNIVWEEITATAMLSVLPPKKGGPYPSCHTVDILSGPRCSGGVCTPPTY